MQMAGPPPSRGSSRAFRQTGAMCELSFRAGDLTVTAVYHTPPVPTGPYRLYISNGAGETFGPGKETYRGEQNVTLN